MAYWLLKTEPGAWSWADQVKAKTTDWTGVRNPQATSNLRAMRVGDRAFFYHTGEERQIVGVVEVTREFYPDPDDTTGKFGMVDVTLVGPVPKPVTLAQVKAEPKLADFLLVRQGRLSVVPVTPAQWKLIGGMAGLPS